MHIVTFDKTITVEDNIDELTIVNLDDNINYLTRSDGVLIKGKVNITGEYICNNTRKQFFDILEINYIVNYENITDKNAISMKIEDFDYINGGQKIVFNFKMRVEGWKELPITFQTSDVGSEQKAKEKILDDIIVINNSDELSKALGKLGEIKQKTTEPDLEFQEVNIKNFEQQDVDINDDINEYLGFDVSDDVEVTEDNRSPETQYPFKIIEENHKVGGNIFDSLFKDKDKSNYTKLCRYHVVLNGETYEIIAAEYNIPLEQLKQTNNHIALVEGNIIKIPTIPNRL